MHVVSDGDDVKGAFDIQRIDGSGKFVIDGTEVEALGGVGGAIFFDQAGEGAAARKANVIEQGLLRARDVRHFVERHAQLIAGAAVVDFEIAGAHAHDVREYVESAQ